MLLGSGHLNPLESGRREAGGRLTGWCSSDDPSGKWSREARVTGKQRGLKDLRGKEKEG